MFDISANKDVAATEDEGIVVPIKDLNGDPQSYEDNGVTKPAVIRVAGTYSTTYRRAAEASREKAMKRRRVAPSGAQMARQELELIAACVLSWEGLANAGQPFPCTKANAIALLDACPWIRQDVEAAMGDHESFFSNSSPS